MRPSPAEPSITIIGNSVPPPSMRCTLVSAGQANFPYSESSHARAHDAGAGGQAEHHAVRRNLAVDLARGIEGVALPPPPVVPHALGIPLREIEAPPLAPRAPRERRGPPPPIDLHHP